MAAKLISLNLYADDLTLLDALVEGARKKSFTPTKVNRSTVIRDLVVAATREINRADQGGSE
jgi:hypothetical protein